MKRISLFLIAGIFLFFGFTAQATTDDRDNDGLFNDAEVQIYGTSPDKPDTDMDGVSDGQEVEQGSDPILFSGQTYTAQELDDLPGTRRIDVDLSELRLRYYAGTTLVGDIPISSGTAKYPSPRGTFSVLKKIPIKHYIGPGYNLPNTKWNLQFYGGYYIHGAYWHNDFGIRPRSHGCINVSYRDMPQLYEFAKIGTKVTVHQ